MINEEYAIYLRKSRSDIELEKYNKKLDTLDRHMKILNNLCITEKYNVTKIYKEVVSGETINERKEMQALIKEVRNNKYRGVLVVEISRLSRGDKIDQGRIAKIFKYTNTLVITPDKVYDLSNEKDEEAFEDELTNSGKELKTIKKRLNRGKRSSILEGKYVGSIPPYGYNRVKIENDKGFTLVENIEEGIIVKKIFEMFVNDDLGYNKIASELNAFGITPRKGELWSSSSIKEIVRNPVYIGKIRWNYRAEKKFLKEEEIGISRPRNNKPLIIDGIHTKIVDETIWNLAQIKINSKVVPIQKHNSIKNPLAHILVCKKCGSYMQRRPYNKTGYEDVIQCIHQNCNNVSSKLKIVEKIIVNALKYWFSEYKTNGEKLIQKSKLNKRQQNIDKIKMLYRAIDKEKNRLRLIIESYEDGTYDKIIYKERYAITTNKISILKDEITKNIQQDNKNDDTKILDNTTNRVKNKNVVSLESNTKLKHKKSINYDTKNDKTTKSSQEDKCDNYTRMYDDTVKTTKKENKIRTKDNIEIKHKKDEKSDIKNDKTSQYTQKDNKNDNNKTFNKSIDEADKKTENNLESNFEETNIETQKSGEEDENKNLNIMELYYKLESFAEKNRFLRAIVKRIEYEKEKGSNMTLIIHPKLPRKHN